MPTPNRPASPAAFAAVGAVVAVVVASLGEPEAAILVLGGLAGYFWAVWTRDADRLRDLNARLERLERLNVERLGADQAAATDAQSRPAEPSEPAEPLVPPVAVPAPEPASRPSGTEARTPDRPAAPRPAEAPRRTRPPVEPVRRRHAETTGFGELAAPLRRAWAFATGGNPFVRVALLILFVGIGLGLRYAVAQGFFPVEARLGVAGVFGAVLVALGWSVRTRNPSFGLAVQGGGVAVLYLTVYSAYALFGLLLPLAAIAMMAAVSVLCAVLAVVQGAPGLAVLGVAGGFAAPVLAGTAEGSHVLLLSYYALLNLGVLGIAWTRAWRSVALVGFAGTFVTGGLWGGLSYVLAMYASVQPFLIVSFAVYFALAIRFAVRGAQEPERTLGVDGALVFGLPAVTFALQVGLVEGIRYGRAQSAAALAIVYLVAWILVGRRDALRLLSDAFLAIGLVFATLALPLAFTRVAFGAMWVLEGAALVWVGARQGKAWMRASGLALQVAAAGVLFRDGVLDLDRAFTPETLTGWLVAVSLGLTAYILRRWSASVRAWERVAGSVALAFGVVWWAATAMTHVTRLTPISYENAALVAAAGASALLFLGLGRALRWPALRGYALVAIPFGAILWIGLVFGGDAPHDHYGFAAWPLLLGASSWPSPTGAAPRARTSLFSGLVWLATGVVSHEVSALLPDAAGWTAAAFGFGIALALVAVSQTRRAHPAEHQTAAMGLALAAAIWALLVPLLTSGPTTPLYVPPVLHPVDLATVALVAALVVAGRAFRVWSELLWSIAGASALVGLAAIVARAAHALGAVPYTTDAMWASARFQAPLAVVWTLLALALTLWGARRHSRPLWFFGVSVLALVVAKLFVVDLAQARALEIVAAFVVVGVLVLVVGYRSPLPPRRASSEDDPRDPDGA